MPDLLAYIYTPTETTDGEGGYTTSLSSPSRIFVRLQWTGANLTAEYRRNETVNNDDIMLIAGEYYRVTGETRDNVITGKAVATIIKTEQPI